jgi:hypothetical protein
MEKAKMFTDQELLDLIHAEKLAETYLTDNERKILEQIDGEKEKLEKELGRTLGDNEEEYIEKSVEGGYDVVVKLGGLIPEALKQVRIKGSKNIH